MTRIETARLLLRPWHADDLGAYLRLFADPQVVRFISDGRPLPAERVVGFSTHFLQQWRRRGFGPFAAIDKASGQWIGEIGLNHLDEWPGPHKVEVGFELLPSHWGRGLATEGALACVRFGFEVQRLERIISVTNPANLASRRVMEKAGLTYQGLVPYRGHQTAWYAIDRATWEATTAAE